MKYLKLVIVLLMTICTASNTKGMLVDSKNSLENKACQSSEKEIRCSFVDEGDKTKNFRFAVFQANSNRINPIQEGLIPTSGEFCFRYPENIKEKYKLIISYDNIEVNNKYKEGAIVISADIAVNTERIIVLFNGVKKKVVFVKEGEIFYQKYKTALDNFRKVDKSKEVNLAREGVETLPIYPGCENQGFNNLKQCFNQKISRFIMINFDSESLKLSKERHRIMVTFIVDKQGKVVLISIKTPYEEVKKEIKRIFKKIPKLKPGTKNNNPIKSKFRLPIIFHS